MGIQSAIRKRKSPTVPVPGEAGSRGSGRTAFDELSRASALLSSGTDFGELESILVEQACDITRSDLAALYLYTGDPRDPKTPLRLSYKRGPWSVPASLARSGEALSFLEDCGEAAVLNRRRPCALEGILLHPEMASGMALPVAVPKAAVGILFVNARTENHYDRIRLNFLGSFCALAAGMLRSSRLFQELKEHVAVIESLERYQESVFSSMTNLLVTTERDGSVRYFNEEAARAFGLSEEDVGRPLNDLLGTRVDAKILRTVEETLSKGSTILGVEGIAAGARGDLDFSLNLSPIRGKRSDRHDGLTLLFTDQSRERALKERMNVVVEERRAIKDMFSRYLSSEVVQHLMESPDQVRLGGAGKKATVFFADIRGYTSFSEGRTPEYIVEVLNDYFSQAVEVVLQYKGFIDKFIGDCIMAAWGVPMTSEAEDAVNAVTCALEIQKLIEDPKRTFFRGDAEHLRVGIGMHTGYLVAGNLGSSRRMNYSVIGDTVNVAARLEGVAKAGEVIITEDTRGLLGSAFQLEEREPVKVKGKVEPIHIYRAVKRR
ncbi:MAG TPA: adenylate/guanylate cyclase domain-containing protein [Spirochaetia bacterium]|nr:adenylate/guanylate cyclase domain-containing protein [Spirochaetales bacterium]HRY79547.1 adenylate/guanylate cyclase domain-containing protein [Spirochaetia bacterium]